MKRERGGGAKHLKGIFLPADPDPLKGQIDHCGWIGNISDVKYKADKAGTEDMCVDFSDDPSYEFRPSQYQEIS